MDNAWIGVIGGGVGAAATFAGTAYTQWRAERLRTADRLAEEKRWREERRLEDLRWERDRHNERQDASRVAWHEKRRQVYLEFAQSALTCMEKFAATSAVLGAQFDLEADQQPPSKAAEAFQGVARRRMADAEESWITLNRCHSEMTLLATPDLLESSHKVWAIHGEVRFKLREPAPDVGQIDALLEAVEDPITKTFSLIRAELGIDLPTRRPSTTADTQLSGDD
ncbi:hypothetical protein ACFX43_06980 [Nocardioides sp. YIM B13467]|uniref:hypothetical protein n=1 Tax=Nocardioides sp. YIM B13467 TaxID=3366294 RepID=UPI00366E963E